MKPADNSTSIAKKKLVSGTMVYLVGNALVSIVQLFMLPLITNKVSTEEYGYFTFVVTMGSLFLPIVTLQISDAVFKFFITSSYEEKSSYYTASVVVTVLGCLVTIFGVFITSLFYPIANPSWVILYFISNIVFVLYTKIARGLDRNRIYVIYNLIKSVLYAGLLFVFLSVINLAEISLFASSVISTFISIILMEKALKTRKYFKLATLNCDVFKNMLKYSLPLAPNTMLWWLNSSVNTLIVTLKMGLDINGVYSVSNKFPAVLSMATSMFVMAWQESAVREYGKIGSKIFFSETTNDFIRIVWSLVVCIIPFTRAVMPRLISEEYGDSINYAAILFVSIGFSSIASFYGQFYAANGRTMGAMKTTILSVGVNLLLVFLLIDTFGLYAPAIASTLSYATLSIVRHISFKDEMGIVLNRRLLIILSILLAIVIIAYHWMSISTNIIVMIIMIFVAVLINRDLVYGFYTMLKSFAKKKQSQTKANL